MSATRKSALKALAMSFGARSYHRLNRIEATRILRSIELDKGELTRRDKRLCDEYAADVFSHRHFAPWLYVYSAMSGGFKEGWIPDNYYGWVVVPQLKGDYGTLSRLKPLNRAIFQSGTFPDVLSYVNGTFVDTQYRFVPIADVEKILFRDADRVVFKGDGSEQGRGVKVFDRAGFSVEEVQRIGNGLFQTYIKQHDLLTAYSEHAVATIRMTTVCKDGGDVDVRACYLRFGTGDATHVKSQSQVRVPIDLKTGAFSDVAYTPEWRETRTHPTSGLAFAGGVIPSFEACKHTVNVLHKRVPYAACVGWDVTVDRDQQVKVIEWNAEHNDIKFGEAIQGPCFTDLGWEKLADMSIAPNWAK